MVYVSALVFGSAALMALAISVWVRPGVPLGRLFWILTALVVTSPLIPLALLLISSPDPYGYGLVGTAPVLFALVPIAGGWLFGVLVSLIVRFVRGRARRTSTTAKCAAQNPMQPYSTTSAIHAMLVAFMGK